MKRFKIIIWNWQEKVLEKEYDFRNTQQANAWMEGLYEGIKYQGGKVTGNELIEL
jgi:hypothetical protein